VVLYSSGWGTGRLRKRKAKMRRSTTEVIASATDERKEGGAPGRLT